VKPFRVLHLDTERGFGGGQRQLLFLIRELAAEGVEQGLAAPRGAPSWEKAAAFGATLFPIAARNDLDLWSAALLRRAVGRYRPQLLHAHTSRALGLTTLARTLLGMKPLPLVLHTRRVTFPLRGPVSAWKYRVGADFHLGVCRAALAQLEEAGVAADRMALVHSGVELPERVNRLEERESLLQLTDFSPDTLLVGASGGLLPVKRFDWLLRAAGRVSERFPRLRLVIWGEGPERARLESLRRALGLEGAVRFLGHVERPERFYGGLDVFVLPSRLEGIGISLAEASARGVPLLASRTGGLGEVVEEGVNGLLFDVTSLDDLTGKLELLLAEETLRVRLGSAGPSIVRERFDVRAVTRRVLAIYRQLAL
jgi:L-malate glycosyltransferase